MKSVKIPKSEGKEESHQDPSPSEFSTAITRVAVAQICQSVGFKASQLYALRTLTRVAAIYLQALGECASSRAASCGRTETNLFDVIHAIEALTSAQGFQGAADVNQPLLSSKALLNIRRFVHSIKEIPFAKPIRRHDDSIKGGASSSIKESRIFGNNSHIPNWLPAFPDPNLYASRTAENKLLKQVRNCGGFLEANGDCRTLFSPGANGFEIGRWELPAKRERVRFKMGIGRLGSGAAVEPRNGSCRGSGRRVSWHNQEEEDDYKIQKRIQESSGPLVVLNNGKRKRAPV